MSQRFELVSIIVPMYNVEDWICPFLDSLLPLDPDKYEVIVVDDGSTDGSLSRVQSYAGKLGSLIIHQQINGGISDARNAGLALASGDYVCFLDSDDVIDSEVFKDFVAEAVDKKVDVAFGNGYHLQGPQNGARLCSSSLIGLGVAEGTEYYDSDHTGRGFRTLIPLCLYRKKFLEDEVLEFHSGIIHEDEDFTPKVFALAKRVIYLDKFFYFYRHRIGSVTKCVKHKYLNPKSSRSFIEISTALNRFLVGRELTPCQKKVIVQATFKCILEVLRRELYYYRNFESQLVLSQTSKNALADSLSAMDFSRSQRLCLLKFQLKISIACSQWNPLSPMFMFKKTREASSSDIFL